MDLVIWSSKINSDFYMVLGASWFSNICRSISYEAENSVALEKLSKPSQSDSTEDLEASVSELASPQSLGAEAIADEQATEQHCLECVKTTKLKFQATSEKPNCRLDIAKTQSDSE